MSEGDLGRGALAGVLVTILVVAFDRIVTTVYVLNFDTAGPNATAVLVALLVTGWTIPFLPLLWAEPRRTNAAVIALAAAIVASMAEVPLVALLGAIAVLVVGTPLLVGVVQPLRERVAISCALGTGLFLAVRAWQDTVPAYATTAGRGVMVGLAAAVIVVWSVPEEVRPDEPLRRLSVSPLPLVGYLWVVATYFGSPAGLAAWTGGSYPLVAVATVGGLTAGSFLVVRLGVPDVRATVVWILVFLASAVLVLSEAGPGGLSAFPAHLAAVVLVARGSVAGGKRGLPRATVEVVALQVAGVGLLFSHVAALNWTYVPAPVGELVAGRAQLLLLATWLLLPAAVAVDGLRSGADDTTRQSAPGSVEMEADTTRPTAGRRGVLGVVATGALGLAGVGLGESAAAGRGDGGNDLTVMTYNVRQFLAPGGDHSHEAVRDVVAAEDPDVVGLQETATGRVTSGAHDGVRWLAHELGYHYAAGPPTSEATYGVGVLSRWPIERRNVVLLPVGNSQPYPALVVELDTPDGTLPVVVAHFQVQVEGHRQGAEAEAVVDLAGGYDRAVVLGDFNATPGAEAYRILDGAFDDAWTVAGTTDGDGDTFSAADPRRRIDYVWITDDWTVERAWTAGTPTASDHRAVLARLEES